MLKNILTLILLTSIFATPAISQDVALRLIDSKMKIEGTSNVRDWDANVNNINASLVLTGIENIDLKTLKPENFSSLVVYVPVKDIESDTRGLTGNIHKYLKVDEYPSITFTLKEIVSIETTNTSDVTITAKGTLKAAGGSSDIIMSVVGKQLPNGNIEFTGSPDLKMTDYGISPPTAIMGTVRATDEFKVTFTITVGK
jgi:hypothetical protein